MPKFIGAGQIEVAPGAGFRLITHLFQDVGLQILRLLIVGLGKHQMVHQLGAPPVVAVLECLASELHDSVGTTHGRHIFACDFNGWKRVQGRRVTVEVSQIIIVNRTHVVALGAIVTLARPLICERLR